MSEGLRIDKWLWAARFFKTRGLAQTAIDNGRVLVGDERVKLSRPVRLGDEILVRVGEHERAVIVRGLSDRRGPASEAQHMYEETAESIGRSVGAVKQLQRRGLLALRDLTEKGGVTE